MAGISRIKTLGEYQRIMERFENFNDGAILPDLFLVIRLDARRFGPGWDGGPDDEYPYSKRCAEGFVGAAKYLMSCGFRSVFSFLHGDEVSLFLDPLESANARRRHKLISLLSSAAVIGFFEGSQRNVLFHAKLSEMPTLDHVVEYFLWQRKVASRNFFSSVVRRSLLTQGMSPGEIDSKTSRFSESDRIEYVRQLGIAPESFSKLDRLGATLTWGYPIATSTQARSGAKNQATSDATITPPPLVYDDELPEEDDAYLHYLERHLRREGTLYEGPAKDLNIVQAKSQPADWGVVRPISEAGGKESDIARLAPPRSARLLPLRPGPQGGRKPRS